VQFIRYVIIGGIGVFTDVLVYTALIIAQVDYQGSNFAGYASGTFVSFILNRAFTFKVHSELVYRFVMFSCVAASGLLISSILLHFLIESLSLNVFTSKLAILPVVLCWQYSLNKSITFKESNLK